MSHLRYVVVLGLLLAACGHAAPQHPRNPWPLPSGWRDETIPFPLEFAPTLAHRGVEFVRFAPGFFKPLAPGYWSYAFAWRLDDAADLDGDALASELMTYFRGLIAAVDEHHQIADAERAQIHVTATPSATGVALTARVYDAFGSGAPVDLAGTAARTSCGSGALWVMTLATANTSTELRAELDSLAHSATCDLNRTR